MSRKGLRLWLIALVTCAVIAHPARAADDVALPDLAPLTSVRWNFVATFNDRPLSVCQEEYESFNRGHAVCNELVTMAIPEYGLELVAGRVDEVIVYDETFYLRFDDDTTWTAIPNPNYVPQATINDLYRVGFAAALTRLGLAEVSGATATQYQYWSLDPDLNAAAGGQAVYDLFISDQNRVLKSQLSYRGALSMGMGELAGIYVYRDFNAPITVYRPPADKVQAATGAVSTLNGRWLAGMIPFTHP
jgi:hypothetical protein